ncbi:hypothetical protein D6C89_07581 [Aureobasidium pullulans]|nr:hypothetical protein D6C89_07581 [Aureobasidium pullulans]
MLSEQPLLTKHCSLKRAIFGFMFLNSWTNLDNALETTKLLISPISIRVKLPNGRRRLTTSLSRELRSRLSVKLPVSHLTGATDKTLRRLADSNRAYPNMIGHILRNNETKKARLS